MMLPRIDFRRGYIIKRYNLGDYMAEIYTNCKSLGRSEYQYVMVLMDKHNDLNPCLAIAAEVVTENRDILGDYILSIFPGRGHFQLRYKGNWDDLTQFTEKALAIAEAHFSAMQLPASA